MKSKLDFGHEKHFVVLPLYLASSSNMMSGIISSIPEMSEPSSLEEESSSFVD